jgi:hypothetical protein
MDTDECQDSGKDAERRAAPKECPRPSMRNEEAKRFGQGRFRAKKMLKPLFLQPETRNQEPETTLFLFNLPRDFAALKTRPPATFKPFNLPTFQPFNSSPPYSSAGVQVKGTRLLLFSPHTYQPWVAEWKDRVPNTKSFSDI